MKNIDRLSRFVTKNGSKDVLVHTISGTSNWIICQKMETDKWLVTLCNPMGNVTYNLGTVTDSQHLQLWAELTKMEIEHKTNQIMIAKELRDRIRRFTKDYEDRFKKFTHRNINKSKKSKK